MSTDPHTGEDTMEELPQEVELKAEQQELSAHVDGAKAEIVRGAEKPVNGVARQVEQTSVFAAVKKAAEPHVEKMAAIGFKDIKARGAVALGLLPLLGGGSAAWSAGKGVFEAAKVEGASVMRAGYIGLRATAAEGTGRVVGGARGVGEILRRGNKDLAGAAKLEGAGKVGTFFVSRGEAVDAAGHAIGHRLLHKTMEILDPTPDVPPAVSLVSGIAGIALPGVGAIPGLWQVLSNEWAMTKERLGLAKDVTKALGSHISGKFDQLKGPESHQAAKVFMPKAA